MTLRSGEVAERAGVNLQTLRYYERRGLLAPPLRTLGGHRSYPEDTVQLLRVIKAAQRLGFTLDEVSELIDTRQRGHITPDLRTRAETKILEVQHKIDDLVTIRESLEQVVAAGCTSIDGCTCPQCPIPFVDIAHGDQA
ncbi:MerR family transcriptional regulator [Microbacterium deminutum]|uniref:Zn(2+)-responsive transcriptional regulator n=1 Tax=Microbacterium deminutum TaxID=344164 RepID=A0ABN2Q545_9MICO